MFLSWLNHLLFKASVVLCEVMCNSIISTSSSTFIIYVCLVCKNRAVFLIVCVHHLVRNTVYTGDKLQDPSALCYLWQFFLQWFLWLQGLQIICRERFQVGHLIKYRSNYDNTFYEPSVRIKLSSPVKGLLCVAVEVGLPSSGPKVQMQHPICV